MGKTFVQGLVLLVAGIVALALNQVLNLGLGSITFGLAIGGVLGLISFADGGPVGRMGGFIIGLIVALVMYIVRVLVLNDSFSGQVATLVISLALLTVICALTGGRIPLWSTLLGAALVVGAYEPAFIAAPQNVQTELIQYTTMALVPAALGFLAAIFVAPKVTETQSDEKIDEMAVPAGASGTNSEV